MIGGTDAELRLVADALGAYEERLRVQGRRRPPLLDGLKGQLRAWECLEQTTGLNELDGADGDVVMTPMLLTTRDAAGLLRLSERSLARAMAEGRLRAVREGRSVRFRPEDLQAYVDSLGDEKPTRVQLQGVA